MLRFFAAGAILVLAGWGCGFSGTEPYSLPETRCTDDDRVVSSNDPPVLWQKRLADAPIEVVTDAHGAIYVALYASAGADFGDGVFLSSDTVGTSTVLKLGPDGRALWAK